MKVVQLLHWIKGKYYLRRAVKEALDTLPSAICYFTSTGTIKLCNTAMYDLVRQMTGKDLQSFAELNIALEKCDKTTGIIREGNTFLFPDGQAWKYSSRVLTTVGGENYTEAVFSNVTELYEKRREGQSQAEALQAMNRDLKILAKNLQEMTREQEILNLKSQLHDQMNMGLVAIRRILQEEAISADNGLAITRFRRAIQVLQEDTSCPRDDLAEFIEDANLAGIQVIISGDFPKDKDLACLLLSVMREASVNAVRHADATLLDIRIKWTDERILLSISNNGNRPRGEVIPQGGLADLGQMITEAGGRMVIRSQAVFLLQVTLPLSYRKMNREVAR
ncbi:sensor histidine kinase [Peptococcus simiae]|uniref:sensor histidine kinase n=1 Tax=Peptococcus simiae TaxID=1643805 RepID=UPI00397ED9BA